MAKWSGKGSMSYIWGKPKDAAYSITQFQFKKLKITQPIIKEAPRYGVSLLTPTNPLLVAFEVAEAPELVDVAENEASMDMAENVVLGESEGAGKTSKVLSSKMVCERVMVPLHIAG